MLEENDDTNASANAYGTVAKGDSGWGTERRVANWSRVDPSEVQSWPLSEVPRLLLSQY